jgi:MYXO-CTERM domain-containing protein
VVAFDLTPKASRPYAGSSTGNSMLELIVVHNGLERFVRNRPVTVPAPVPAANPAIKFHDSVPAGPLRLADPMLAGQFSWLLPLAVLGAVLAWRRRRAAVVLWGTWALTYGIVYSAAGGIFHIYYLATLAPPLAALGAIGCIELWRHGSRHLAFGLAATGLWQGYLAAGSLGWTSTWIAFPALALLAGGAVLWRDKRPPAFIGGIALLVLPVAWALSAVFSPGSLTLPSASLPRWLGIDDGRGPALSRTFRPLSDDPKLREFLLSHRGNSRFLVAAPTAVLAAPIIVRTGLPVLAVGGFSGADPILTTDALAEMTARGEFRYALVNNRGRQGPFARWVRSNGTVVDPALWRSLEPESWRSISLYDLAPPR